jgi:hypothetical protein
MTVTAPVLEALEYEAPFLIEKLLKERIVETASEAGELFQEVKRYLVLAHTDDSIRWQMYSLRVDECWHQFVLFSRQYFEFCNRYFGKYLPHSPSNAPESAATGGGEEISFEEFALRYAELFGTPLPDTWYDERSITTSRRVVNDRAGRLALRHENRTVELLHGNGEVLFSINELAREAMAFIAATGAFYVRELPGDLDDDEKIALVATLVEHKLLRVAP